MREKPYVSDGPKPPGKYWRPLLRGSLIGRYRICWDNNYWIKYGPWLAAPRDPAIFDAPEKICVRQTGDSIIATLVDNRFIERNNLHIIISKTSEASYLMTLGLLNSTLMNFIYSYMNPEQGEALAEVKKEHVEKLLIPSKPSQQKEIEGRVEKILELTNENPGADVSALEAEIDQMVYELYGLTEEEIKIVEKGTA